MKKFNKAIGDFGEDISASYLLSLGFEIIKRNFNCRLGEIDIIARKKNIIHFVEVKSRYNRDYGFPMESVNFSKMKKLRLVAKYYIVKNHFTNINCCFDVLEIFLEYNSKDYKINFLEDAFR